MKGMIPLNDITNNAQSSSQATADNATHSEIVNGPVKVPFKGKKGIDAQYKPPPPYATRAPQFGHDPIAQNGPPPALTTLPPPFEVNASHVPPHWLPLYPSYPYAHDQDAQYAPPHAHPPPVGPTYKYKYSSLTSTALKDELRLRGLKDDGNKKELIRRLKAHDQGQDITLLPEFLHCNCRKTKCLKLYCECFAAKVVCNGCNCENCHNTSNHEAIRQEAFKATKSKNSTAFKSKFSKDTKAHVTGCKCKKSKCLKKYCECFESGITCGAKCKCENCKNFAGSDELIQRRKRMGKSGDASALVCNDDVKASNHERETSTEIPSPVHNAPPVTNPEIPEVPAPTCLPVASTAQSAPSSTQPEERKIQGSGPPYPYGPGPYGQNAPPHVHPPYPYRHGPYGQYAPPHVHPPYPYGHDLYGQYAPPHAHPPLVGPTFSNIEYSSLTGTRLKTHDRGQDITSPELLHCKCRKSKCLKLYCDCFAAQVVCNGCKCNDCHNTSNHEAIRQEAFKATGTGCVCKKKKCLMLYCNCFASGITCGAKCNCKNCENFAESDELIEQRNAIGKSGDASVLVRNDDVKASNHERETSTEIPAAVHNAPPVTNPEISEVPAPICLPVASTAQSAPSSTQPEERKIQESVIKWTTKRKCKVNGCENNSVKGGVCVSHGAKCKKCSHPGCTKNAKKAGVCRAHGATRTLRKLCESEGCTTLARIGGICVKHGANAIQGGRETRKRKHIDLSVEGFNQKYEDFKRQRPCLPQGSSTREMGKKFVDGGENPDPKVIEEIEQNYLPRLMYELDEDNNDPTKRAIVHFCVCAIEEMQKVVRVRVVGKKKVMEEKEAIISWKDFIDPFTRMKHVKHLPPHHTMQLRADSAERYSWWLKNFYDCIRAGLTHAFTRGTIEQIKGASVYIFGKHEGKQNEDFFLAGNHQLPNMRNYLLAEDPVFPDFVLKITFGETGFFDPDTEIYLVRIEDKVCNIRIL